MHLKISMITALMVLCGTMLASAQTFLLQDINGRPLKQGQYEDVQGSPFFNDEYTIGRVMLSNGNIYEGVPIRFDLVTDALMFKSEKGEELEFTQPVTGFSMLDGKYIFKNGYEPVDNYSSTSFYQVLTESETKASLLKNIDKLVRTEKAYGTANINKNIIEYSNYYIANSGKLMKVKNEKDLLEALANHGNELKGYIKEQKLKLKNEGDMVQLVKYYNSL